MHINIQEGLKAFVCIMAFATWGCGANNDDAAQGVENVASTELAITNVPAGVLCVKAAVSVAGQTVNPPALTVAAGTSSATLNLGQLPAGSATFQANAYNVACASVTSSTVASWVADSATATLAPGIVATVQMTFHQNNNVTVNANFVSNVAAVYAGFKTSMALMSDGTVTQWGAIGNSLYTAPSVVPTLSNVAQVAVGSGYACASKKDGTLWCWGSNTAGALGSGVAIGGATATPVQISLGSGTSVTALSAGANHVCAIVTGATLYCWGNNAEGEFGIGTTVSSTTPVYIRGGVGLVSAGTYNTCIADNSSGLASCTGRNAYGQLGTGSTTDSTSFAAVKLAGSTVAIAVGLYHTCFLGADAVVHCAGSNATGALGDGTTISRTSPVEVALLGASPVQQIQAGYTHSCALSGGVVSCWGSAAQDGTGGASDMLIPVNVPGLSNATAVHTSMGSHSCAELSDRSVRCWGSNAYGQIGDGTQVYAPKPATVVF